MSVFHAERQTPAATPASSPAAFTAQPRCFHARRRLPLSIERDMKAPESLRRQDSAFRHYSSRPLRRAARKDTLRATAARHQPLHTAPPHTPAAQAQAADRRFECAACHPLRDTAVRFQRRAGSFPDACPSELSRCCRRCLRCARGNVRRDFDARPSASRSRHAADVAPAPGSVRRWPEELENQRAAKTRSVSSARANHVTIELRDAPRRRSRKACLPGVSSRRRVFRHHSSASSILRRAAARVVQHEKRRDMPQQRGNDITARQR